VKHWVIIDLKIDVYTYMADRKASNRILKATVIAARREGNVCIKIEV
jgi:hypothetical protein